MGFYRRISEDEVEVAPNFVHAPTYTIDKKDKNKPNLPEGWMWFNTDAAANMYFGVVIPLWTEDRVKQLTKSNTTQILNLLNKITMPDVPETLIDDALKQKKRYK